MIASNREGEITFYEELGVTPEASSQEIRDAFRLLVRLVHPDQQPDPQLKEIAERQMRKLNRVYAVLSDPGSRRRYDETLDEDPRPPTIIFTPPSPDLQRLLSRIAWGAAIFASAGLLLWLASDSTPGAPVHGNDGGSSLLASTPGPVPARAASIPEEPEVAQLRSSLRLLTVERDAAISELNRLRKHGPDSRSTLAPALDNADQRALTITELPSAPKQPPPANSMVARLDRPVRTEAPVQRQLDGFWFYAKPPQGQLNKNHALYPPEYIEATIVESNGVLHGSYRARFRIVDRTISPDVSFTFSGAPSGSQLNCQWTGLGGARGDLVLKLASDNSMKIDWTATELGTIQGLNSGTAVLTRRIE